MRVLVTGGSGFIGSHVVDKLREHGHEPVIFDLRESPWHDDIETVIGSITDREALEQALGTCDAVAHLAAVADVNDVHAEPEQAEHVNSRGTAAVLEAARRAGVKRVVYASTIWVYSDTASEEVSEETLLPAPSHLYTSTKLAGELYCKSYKELYGIDYTILRFGIPYGPRAREAAVIPAFVNKAFNGEPLTLAGDGLQSRRFVYVEDLAEGVARAFDEVALNRVYNLASNENVTIKQIAETVQELVGNTEIVYTPARPGDFGTKVVASDRAREELGWTAATPFKEGVRRYVEWRRDEASKKSPEQLDPLALAGEPDVQASPRSEARGLAAAAEDSIPETETFPQRVLIISADIGEGHDLPARALAREFREQDPEALISVVNGLPAMGMFMTGVLRENSAWMFRWVPWLFDLQYRLFMDFAVTRWLSRKLLTAFGGRGLIRLVKSHSPDLIVSTYPGVTAILGELRHQGRLRVPCYSSITDLAGLQFWSHPGIDMHFVTHPESIEEVEKIAGPGSVRWAKPPTTPAFMAPRARAQARRALELPQDATVIAVSGGGWGVGDVIGAVAAALDVADAEVLCLCGHNEGLRQRVTERFGGDPRLRVMGFTNQMSDVLTASDALVHSSAGLTVLEALIRGCPVVSYGFGYGHVRVSNVALERFKLARVARTEAELRPALKEALEAGAQPDDSFMHRASTAALVAANDRRIRPLPPWRVRAVRTVTAFGAAAVIGVWGFTASIAYTLVSALGATPEITAVTTPKAQVGVLVDASAKELPRLAQIMSSDDMHVSFALSSGSPSIAQRAEVYGDETVPRLPDSGLVSWISTKGRLDHLVHEFGWPRNFIYASSGSSVAQWILAHHVGGQLIGGAVRISNLKQVPSRLRPGEVIEIRANSVTGVLPQLYALAEQLQDDHLQAVPVGKLLRGSGLQVGSEARSV